MSLTMCNMSRRAVHFLVMVIMRVNMGSSALDYRDYRFPCGPEDCSESVTCWNDSSDYPLLNSPTSELGSTFVGQLECETIDGNGRTLLQRRTHTTPHVDFNMTLRDYETGFGDIDNFWIGLNRIHRLTSKGRTLLTIGYIVWSSAYNVHVTKLQMYPGFWVDDESNQYTMYAGQVTPAGPSPSEDSLEASKGRPFTAPDGGTAGCANEFGSGWWFGRPCRNTTINLNGRHSSTGRDKIFVGALKAVTCSMAIRQTVLHCDMTCPNGGTCRKNHTVDSYVCDCQPRYTGRRCEDLVEDTTVATTHATAVKAIPTTTVKAIPTTTVKAIPTATTSGSNISSRNVTSPTTPSPPTTRSPLDVFDLFAYVFLPVFLTILFIYAILALVALKCVETRKKEMNLNTAEETPLVRKTKIHKKRRRTKKKVTKGNTSSTSYTSYTS